MVKSKYSTRNEVFNGYEYAANSYATVDSGSIDKIKKLTNERYKTIKLLDVFDYVKTTGEKIVTDALNNKQLQMIGNDVVIDYTDEDFNNSNPLYIFGAPYKMELANKQNYFNCGVESTLNTLIMGGKMELGSENKTEKNFLTEMWTKGYCDDAGEIGVLDKNDGGSSIYNYKLMLSLYGIDSYAYGGETDVSVELTDTQFEDDNLCKLGYKIRQGHGAIIAVSTRYLWEDTNEEDILDHAVAITGVVYSVYNPTKESVPVGFYIQDTGAWRTRFITTEDLMEVALYEQQGTDPSGDNYNKSLKNKDSYGIWVTITKDPIKDSTNNIDFTGDKYANEIYGNIGDNKLYGMNGNDSLYGGSGNDSLYGGNGNDYIIGGNLELPAEGTNYLDGGANNDTIIGGQQSDTIYGGNGNDILYGYAGIDIIHGGSGKDTIYGGTSEDRIFGEAGNDLIYGDEGDDIITAGAGNDTVYGGVENDKIDLGAGSDVVIIEGQHSGADYIYLASGSAKIKFDHIYDENDVTEEGHTIDDLKFLLTEKSGKGKYYNLDIYYQKDVESAEDGVSLESFYNYTSNTNKVLTIEDCNDDIYRVKATKSKNAVVANTSTSGKNKDINNVLLSTNIGDTNIKTSKKDDIVHIMDFSGDIYNEKVFEKQDVISYTGGFDQYYSEIGNTTYNVAFNKDTELEIYDNVDLLKKSVLDPISGEMVTQEIAPSDNDVIKFNNSQTALRVLFDVTKDQKVSENTSLVALFTESIGDVTTKIINFVQGNDIVSGFVEIADFFKTDEDIDDDYEFYGNGQIEHFYTTEYVTATKKNYVEYTGTLQDNIAEIAENVAVWLSVEHGGHSYDSAFAAIEDNAADLTELIACYTSYNA